MTVHRDLLDSRTAADLAALRERGPLTHCLTNVVAASVTANVLLAVGASPAMVENVEESAEFAGLADAVLANLGTLSEQRGQALRLATSGARSAGTPWVLDPVAAGALSYRTTLAKGLLGNGPAIVRGNASEVLSLAESRDAAGKGVESLTDAASAVDAARTLANAHRCVVAVSGERDYVTDGGQVIEVHGGHPLMTRVTGVGCALGAVMAAFLAVSETPLRAAVSASMVFAVAGAKGAEVSSGPGSLAVTFLDELSALDGHVQEARP